MPPLYITVTCTAPFDPLYRVLVLRQAWWKGTSQSFLRTVYVTLMVVFLKFMQSTIPKKCFAHANCQFHLE